MTDTTTLTTYRFTVHGSTEAAQATATAARVRAADHGTVRSCSVIDVGKTMGRHHNVCITVHLLYFDQVAAVADATHDILGVAALTAVRNDAVLKDGRAS